MPLRPFATAIVQKLQQQGHIAYFAGGWVRDFLMQHPSDDIDIATSASVEEIQALFPKTVPVGISFGIVIVVEGGHPFEVATFRKEGGYIDGRRPTHISSATPEEDAQRRDFTINGMFWDPIREELFDFVEGRKDIEGRVVRAIGDPHERFLEDRLRMMRAVRYSTRFEFPIDPATKQAIVAHAKSLFPAVAIERVWQEFKKMSQFAHFDRGLVVLHRLELLPTIFPELEGVSVEEIESRVALLPHFPKSAPTISELLELFPNYSLEQSLLLCDFLKLSRQERETVEFLYRARALLQRGSQLEKAELAGFYAEPQAELALALFALHLPSQEQQPFLLEHKNQQVALESAVTRIRKKTPLVTSQDLRREGVAPGKVMGLLLKEAERLSINHGLTTLEEVLHFLKQSPLWDKI